MKKEYYFIITVHYKEKHMLYWAGDLHLGKNIRKSCSLTKDDCFDALKYMSKHIIENKPKDEENAVIFAGDVFEHKKVDGLVLDNFIAFIDALFVEGVSVYTIQGNHELGDKNIAVTQGAYDLNKKLIDINGTKIYGLDYLSREELQKEVKNVPPCDVLVLHTAFSHMIGFEGVADISISDIPDQIKNVFVGDIHSNVVEKMPQGYCVSPGPLHSCNVAQNETHGFYKWNVSMPEWVFQDIPNRKILRYRVSEWDEVDNIAKELSGLSFMKQPIVEIVYTPNVYNKVKVFRQSSIGKYIVFDKPVGANMLFDVDEEELEAFTGKVKLEDVLSAAVNPDNEPLVYTFMHNLLTSDNHSEYVDELIRSTIEEA